MKALPAIRSVAAGLLLAGATLLLGGCDAVVEVNATASVPPRYTSVLVTVEEVWLNKSANAAPGDAGWEKHRLDEARTLDLVRLNGGLLANLVDDMVVPPGRYRQVRVLLAGTHDDLHDSADDLDAEYNNEVTWFDEDGDEYRAPLEVLNAGQGMGIGIDLEVVEAVAAIGGTSSAGTLHVKFDEARDLVEFRYGGRTGFLLNATPEAGAVDEAGTLRGTLNLSGLQVDTWTGRPDIAVTAQRLDEQAGRYVVVGSAFVSRNGAFTLHPLPLDEDEHVTRYDLVIHGPGIHTVILRDVPVDEAPPQQAAVLSLGFITLQPADSFEVNVDAAAVVEPRGARVGFYQTLPGEDEPHLVALATVDPLSGRFAEPVRLSRADTVLHATYGRDSTLRAVTPQQGGARHAVAAWSVQHGHGPFAATTLRPASPVSDTATFSVPAVEAAAPAVAGTLSTTVNVEVPARYDRGVLLATHDGGLVSLATLDAMLQQAVGSAFVDVTVPAGTMTDTLDAGLYALEAWTWHSADPEDTFVRHAGADTVDLRAVSTAAGAVTIR